MRIKPNPEYVNAPYELGYFWHSTDKPDPLPEYIWEMEDHGYKIVPQCTPRRYHKVSDYDPSDPEKNSIPPFIPDEEEAND